MHVHTIACLSIFAAATLSAGPLEDLRVFLRNHPGHHPVLLKVSGEFQQVEESRKKTVEKLPMQSVQFNVADGPSGFQLTWAQSFLADAVERNPAEDLSLILPNLTHASMAWLDPICLSRTINPVRSLQRLLEVAKLKGVKDDVWDGKPAQRLDLAFMSTVPARYRQRANTTNGTLTVWIKPDGTPLASEITQRYQGLTGRFSGEFSRFSSQKTTYGLLEDRLISATLRIEERVAAGWDITRTVLALKVEEEKP